LFVFRGFVTLAFLTLLAGASQASAQVKQDAEELYKHTNYEGSIALLNKHSEDAATNFLLGRDYFMLGEFKTATEYLQRAATQAPENGEYMDWLGRVYGKRAETSNPLFAPGLASKARQAFEKSVELNPKDPDAMSDLFDFYLDAPGFLGGGYDKAAALADKIAIIDPSEGYFEKAKLAQKRKEFQTAEQHLKQALAATPSKVGALLELARFFANQGRTRESDAALAEASKIQPNEPRIWYARADILIKEKRNPDEAKDLLHKYLQAPITVDDPPKEEAARLLKHVGS
jgi:Flp pilus assembly protein TadD